MQKLLRVMVPFAAMVWFIVFFAKTTGCCQGSIYLAPASYDMDDMDVPLGAEGIGLIGFELWNTSWWGVNPPIGHVTTYDRGRSITDFESFTLEIDGVEQMDAEAEVSRGLNSVTFNFTYPMKFPKKVMKIEIVGTLKHELPALTTGHHNHQFSICEWNIGVEHGVDRDGKNIYGPIIGIACPEVLSPTSLDDPWYRYAVQQRPQCK
jgi:hypothetical protein